MVCGREREERVKIVVCGREREERVMYVGKDNISRLKNEIFVALICNYKACTHTLTHRVHVIYTLQMINSNQIALVLNLLVKSAL